MSWKKRDDKLDDLKKDCQALEAALRNEEDPTQHLSFVEACMEAILNDQFGTEVHVEFFISEILPRCTAVLLKRSNILGEPAEKVNQLFQNLIEFSLKCLENDFPDLVECVGKIFSAQQPFYLVQNQNHETPGDLDEELYDIKPKPTGKFGIIDQQAVEGLPILFVQNVEYFANQNGFVLVLKRVKNTAHKIPLYILKAYLRNFLRIRELISISYFQPFIQELQQSIFDLLLGLSSDELKNENPKVVTDIIELLEALMRSVTSTQMGVSETIEKFGLQITYKFFQSPSLEKRIFGLTLIKDIIGTVARKMEWERLREDLKASLQQKQQPNLTWMTEKFLIEWIKEKQILEQIFGGLNTELIKRSLDILKFMASVGMLERKYLDLIWEASLGKHESIIHVVYLIVGELSAHLPTEDIDYLFEKVKQTPFSQCDTHTLYMFRSISYHAINANMQVALSKKKWYALDLYWELAQDEASTPPDISFLAVSLLCDFLGWVPCHSQRVTFMEKCIENLKLYKSVHQSLKILLRIIGTYPEKKSKASDTQSSVIEWLQETHNLLDLFFRELVVYKQLAKKIAATFPPETYLNDIFVGSQTHFMQTKERLEFLDYITSHSKLMLSQDQVDTFWTSVIKDALTQTERDAGFKWLENARGSQHEYPAFSEEVTEYLFLQKVPELDFAFLSPCGFSFFEFFFRYINWQNHKFQQEENHEYVVLSFDLIGMENIWRVALEAFDPIVGKQAIVLLNNLHKNLSADLKFGIGKQREEYIKMCMFQLAEVSKESFPLSSKSELRVNRSLDLFKTFLEEFEHKIGVGSKKHGGAGGTPISVEVRTLQSSRFRLDMLTSDTVGLLRQKISDQVGDPPEMLRLITAGRELKSNTDTLSQSRITGIVFISRRLPKPGNVDAGEETPQKQPKISLSDLPDEQILPSHILSKQEYFDQLFDFLNLEGIAEKVWELLMLLPTNQRMFTEIYGIRTSSTQVNWNKLLGTGSTFKLLYCLQIVESLLVIGETETDEQKDGKVAWREKFVSLQGLTHLFQVLLTNDFRDKTKGGKRKVCLALLLKIVNFFTLDHIISPEKPPIPKLRDIILSKFVDSKALVQRLLELTRNAADDASKYGEDAVQLANVNPATAAIENPDVEVVEHSVSLLVACCLSQTDLMNRFLQSTQIQEWLMSTLLDTKDMLIREKVAQAIQQLCDNSTNHDPRAVFLQHLLSFLPSLKDNKQTCQQYFLLLNNLVSGEEGQDFKDLLQNTLEMIKQHPIVERRDSKVEDHVLIGLLNLMATLLSKEPSVKCSIGSTSHGNLIGEVFHKCLFEIPTAENHGPYAPPKCKTKASRQAAFRLLTELAKDCTENLKEIIDLLKEQHPKGVKRPSWHYLPSAYEKSITGYVGLTNLGATCYMNSLMQQFYMIPQFRHGIISVAGPQLTEDMESQDQPEKADRPMIKDNLLFQMQVMMSYLQEGEKKFYDTKEFCKSYKMDGQPVNPLVQMDANEYFNMLFDKLEELLKGTKQENILKEFFGGTLCNQIMSKECNHVAEREEKFFTLSVDIKNKKSIQDSLELYVEGDMLEGDNKYFCGQCEKKVDALMRACVNDLPDHLIIHAKRFEFDYETFKRNKLNDHCEFPFVLNMEPYTKEGLQRKENVDQFVAIHPPSYYEYQLTGILVHTGTADSGHYYSFIRERDAAPGQQPRWYQFNDTEVELYDPNNIPKDCFGGFDTVSQWEPSVNKYVPKFMNKIYSAYMLFYDRAIPENKTKGVPVAPAQQADIVPTSIYKRIWEENMTFLLEKNTFDLDYSKMILNLISLDKSAPVMEFNVSLPDLPYHPTMHRIILGTNFLFRTLSHAKQKPPLQNYADQLKSLYSKHIPGCRWFLETVLEDNLWLKQSLLYCTLNDTREVLARLIVHILGCVAPFERDIYFDTIPSPEDMEVEAEQKNEKQPVNVLVPQFPGKPKSLVIALMDRIFGLLREAPLHWQHFAQLFLVLREFSKLGSKEKLYMASRNAVAQLIDFYLAEDSPFVKESQQKRRKMGDKVTVPPLTYMVDTLAILVKASLPDPTQAQQTGVNSPALVLSDFDKKLLYNELFYAKILRENINPPGIAEIARCISWEDEHTSAMLIRVCTEGIHKVDHENFKPYHKVFTAILTLHDSLHEKRFDFGMSSYCAVVEANIKYRNATFHSIKFLLDFMPTEPLLSAWLLDHMDQWTESWLMSSKDEIVRETTCHLLLMLVPEFPKLPPHDAPSTGVILSEDATKRVHRIYRHLLGLLPCARKYWRGDVENYKVPVDYDISWWKLVQYFKILKWLCHGKAEKLIFSEFFDEFADLLVHVDGLRILCDENKREMISLWYHVLHDCPENVKMITDNDKLEGRLLDFCISISPSEKLRLYNSVALPPFYSILLLMVEQSPKFLEKLRGHLNFSWTVEHLILETGEYVNTAAIIFPILSKCCDDPAFRAKYIPLIKVNTAHSNPNILRFLDILLQTRRDYMHFCQLNGLKQLTEFLENRHENEKDSEVMFHLISLALELLVRATNWMFLGGDLTEQEKTVAFNVLQMWDSKHSLLVTVIAFVKHFANDQNLLDTCYKLMFNLSTLDHNCLATTIRYLSAYFKQGSNMEGTKKTESFYKLSLRICELAIIQIDVLHFKQAADLALSLGKEALGIPTFLPFVLSLLQKMWRSPLKDSMANSEILDSFLLKVLTTEVHQLDHQEFEAFAKEIAPTAYVNMSNNIKISLKEMLINRLKKNIEELKAGHLNVDQTESTATACIHGFKALRVLAVEDLKKELVGFETELALLGELLVQPNLQSYTRRDELAQFVNAFL